MENIALEIKKACLLSTSKNPIEIFMQITRMPCIRMHGPEHHLVDGACLLTAYYNVKKDFDLEEGLDYVFKEGRRMPGAMCGLWGVCGSVSSVGAALSYIDHSGPLSKETWGDHMTFTSKAIDRQGKCGGPRCCKRDGYIALEEAIEYLKQRDVHLEKSEIHCIDSKRNAQCLFDKCPFFH